jgi:hypothetical protein
MWSEFMMREILNNSTKKRTETFLAVAWQLESICCVDSLLGEMETQMGRHAERPVSVRERVTIDFLLL